jgi:Peptidase family M41
MFDSEIRGQLAMLMGGRAAEEVSCGQISTGAVDDIRRATVRSSAGQTFRVLKAFLGPLTPSPHEGTSPEPPVVFFVFYYYCKKGQKKAVALFGCTPQKARREALLCDAFCAIWHGRVLGCGACNRSFSYWVQIGPKCPI